MNWAEAKPIVEAIPGFLVPGQEEWLFEKAKSLSSHSSIVEIGSYKGRSAAALALGCIDGGGSVQSIDKRDWSPMPVLPNLSFYGTSAISRLCEQTVDLIFLDGSHAMRNILCDFANAYRILKPGGWLVMHDVGCDFPDVTKVWESLSFLLSDHEECSTIRAGRKSYKEHDTP